MSEKRGTKALEVWCKRVTDGYPGVKVENMTTSWRDGLAFCALIHHFRPDLIDFDRLDKQDIYRNNEMAFRIAERHLGIPALLDPEDMVEYEVPDRLCMLTYLSQFYQTFVGQQGHSPNSRTPVKRSSVSPSLSSSPDLSPNMSPTSSSPPSKVPARGASTGASSRSAHDSCSHCALPVFLAERLLVGSKRALYHRTCFRCARCAAQLTLANCYETEDGKFCCETCPDEELDKSDTSSLGTDRADFPDSKSGSICSVETAQETSSIITNQSKLEDVSGSTNDSANTTDEFSALFESTVEKFRGTKPPSQPSVCEALLAESQEVPNDLSSKSDDLLKKFVHSNLDRSKTTDPSLTYEYEAMDNQSQSTKEGLIPADKALAESEELCSSFEQQSCTENVSFPQDKNNVNILDNISVSCVAQSPVSISADLSNVKTCTKDSKTCSAGSTVSSIVKMRKMMFEGENINSVDSLNYFPKSSRNASLEKAEDNNDSLINESSEPPKGRSVDSREDNTDVQKVLPDSINFEERVKESCNEEKVYLSDESKICANNTSCLGDEILGDNYSNEDGCTAISDDLKEKVFMKEIEAERMDSENSCSFVSAKPAVNPRKAISALKTPQTAIAQNKNEDYPVELNPFGDEEEQDLNESGSGFSQESKTKSTNPFGSSEEDEPVELREKSFSHKPPRPPPPFVKQSTADNERSVTTSANRQTSCAVVSPVPAQRRVISVSINNNNNPFWSDGEEPDDGEACTPVPLPRTIRVTPEPSPRPRSTMAPPSKMLNSMGHFGSSSSLSSMVSNTGSNRRSKKPAPAPPPTSGIQSSLNSSLPSSPISTLRSPHKKKSRPAPQPPSSIATDEGASKSSSLDGRKLKKDEANRSKQANAREEPSLHKDKSTYGQWKRKKGPAPPRPLPQRRQVRAMPLKELKRELDDIEVKQLELERQGVKLEQTIRHKFDQTPQLNESSMTPDVEDLVIQLFELVNEKNELFRKQAELMYLRRQQRLEEEHAELEYQIRCLMEQPERNKTDMMKAKEEELIQRLVEVVERRNEIIECLEMDRIREAEEDQSIHTRLGLFAAKNEDESQKSSPSKSKKEKKKKKEKDSKKKKDSKVDADKDIDEVEAAATAAVAACKEKKGKKKWF